VKKYSEEIHRYNAVNSDGQACEILERITYLQLPQADGSLGEPKEVNRRFDLRTGERLNRMSADEFEDDLTGARLRVVP
jgi:hypothetical protein